MPGRVMLFGAWAPIEDVEILARAYKRDKEGQFSSGGGTGGGGVRGALAGHGTAEEVGAAASAEAKRITGRDIAFNMGGDAQIAAEHSEGVLRGLERFPGAGLREVRYGPIEDGGGEAWASTKRDGSQITFNDDAQRYGADSYRQDLKQHAREGYLAKGTGTPTGVALHEFGHSVANSYGANDRAVNHAMDRDRYSQGPGHISRYAQSGGRELVAEGFSSAMTKGAAAPPIAKGILKTIEQVVASGERGHVGG